MCLFKYASLFLLAFPTIVRAEDDVNISASITKSIIFLLLLFISGVLLKKKLGRSVVSNGDREVEVKEMVPLSQKAKLAVVEYGETKMLLGVSDAGIIKLKEENLKKGEN